MSADFRVCALFFDFFEGGFEGEREGIFLEEGDKNAALSRASHEVGGNHEGWKALTPL